MVLPSRVNKNSGFTLIELLIVIAILGVLAVVVLVAINPVEKLAQSRDAGRISSVTQLGHALESYYVSNDSGYPDASNWATDMVQSGDLSTFPAGIAYAIEGNHCNTVVQPNIDRTYCYSVDVDYGAIVFARAEAVTHTSKCPGEIAYFVFSTADGRGGTVCSSGELTPWAAGTMTYVN